MRCVFSIGRIKQLDPKEEFVKINIDEKEIRYDAKIKQHRLIRELTKEEIVRAYLVLKLIRTLKYPADCIELEKDTCNRKKRKENQCKD